MKRYRQPEPRRRNAWQVVRAVVLWVIVCGDHRRERSGGAAYLKTISSSSNRPETKADRAAAKRLDWRSRASRRSRSVIGTRPQEGQASGADGALGHADPRPGRSRDELALHAFVPP